MVCILYSYATRCRPGIDKAIIGRKSSKTKIVLTSSDDKISRGHGLLSVSAEGTVSLTDTSLLGISVDGVRMTKNEPLVIREKQTILFYSLGYKLVRKDYTVCFSSSNAKDKEVSTAFCKEAGITVSKDWTSECSHLVQEKYTTTAKVIRCMLQCRHIVR
jgi:ribosomal protein L13E